jgi:hypothetical protein
VNCERNYFWLWKSKIKFTKFFFCLAHSNALQLSALYSLLSTVWSLLLFRHWKLWKTSTETYTQRKTRAMNKMSETWVSTKACSQAYKLNVECQAMLQVHTKHQQHHHFMHSIVAIAELKWREWTTTICNYEMTALVSKSFFMRRQTPSLHHRSRRKLHNSVRDLTEQLTCVGVVVVRLLRDSMQFSCETLIRYSFVVLCD